jgi:hypothetical protein
MTPRGTENGRLTIEDLRLAIGGGDSLLRTDYRELMTDDSVPVTWKGPPLDEGATLDKRYSLRHYKKHEESYEIFCELYY